MLETLVTSNTPLRPEGLALILQEREKRDSLFAYVGNCLWGVLKTTAKLSGMEVNTPSYSTLVRQMHTEISAVHDENEEIRQKVTKMLNKFSTKEGVNV